MDWLHLTFHVDHKPAVDQFARNGVVLRWMDLSWAGFAQALVASVVYCVLGIILFGLSFLLINALTPFSIRKEIEDDQNVALGLVIASVIIGLSLIISSAVGG